MTKQLTLRLHPLADRDLIYLHQCSDIRLSRELRDCLVAYALGRPYTCPPIQFSFSHLPHPPCGVELHLRLDNRRQDDQAALDILRLLPSGSRCAFVKQLFRYSLDSAPLQGFAPMGVYLDSASRTKATSFQGASSPASNPTALLPTNDIPPVVALQKDPLAVLTPMSGRDFEFFAAGMLLQLGFTNVEVTPASGDQGIDVTAHRGGKRYAIQCKHQIRAIGNDAIQEAYSGAAFYSADVAVVMTTSTFTAQAQMLANATGVVLWDKDVLADMLDGKWNS